MEAVDQKDLLAGELEKEKRKNAIIRQLAIEMSQPSTLKQKLDAILSVLDQRFGLKHTMLLLPDQEGRCLKVFSSRGFDKQGIGAEIKFGEGIIGVVAQRRKKLRLANISRQRMYFRTISEHKAGSVKIALPGLPDVESQVALPLLLHDELIAVLSAESRDLNFFSPEDEDFLMTLSQLMAFSIQNAIVMEQLEEKVQERTHALECKKRELEKANASKDRLFAIIGHDLRSPAASLQNVAELISYYSEKGVIEQVSATGRKVVKAAKTLNAMLDNLLSWSVAQTGELQMQPEKLSLAELAKEVTDIYEDTVSSKNIQITITAPHDVYILADRNAALTILRNLLSNSLKFTHPGGSITIGLSRQEDSAELVVSDNGVGILPENMATLFSLEKRSTRGTAKERGTGLGLLLVKEMVRLNGGQLSVNSIAGKGTSVYVRLPLCC